MPRSLPNTVFLVLVSKSEGEIPLEDAAAVCGIKEAAVINFKCYYCLSAIYVG
jgi:hypothetical protein